MLQPKFLLNGKRALQTFWKNRRNRAIAVTCGCLVIAGAAGAFAVAGSALSGPQTTAASSIPVVVQKFDVTTSSASGSKASTPGTSSKQGASTSRSSGSVAVHVTESDSTSVPSGQPHYVTAETTENGIGHKNSSTSSASSSKAAASSHASGQSSSTSSYLANYQGIPEVDKTYTDEITGTSETVRFLGVGAGYREVGIAEIHFQTSAVLGAAHFGVGKATLTGPQSESSICAVYKTGDGDLFTVSNLTPGTYTATLTAHDGTVVVRFHITVKSGGLL